MQITPGIRLEQADLKQIILTHAHKSHLVDWPRCRENFRSVQILTDFGSADILGVGHGPPITGDAAARVMTCGCCARSTASVESSRSTGSRDMLSACCR